MKSTKVMPHLNISILSYLYPDITCYLVSKTVSYLKVRLSLIEVEEGDQPGVSDDVPL